MNDVPLGSIIPSVVVVVRHMVAYEIPRPAAVMKSAVTVTTTIVPTMVVVVVVALVFGSMDDGMFRPREADLERFGGRNRGFHFEVHPAGDARPGRVRALIGSDDQSRR